VGRDTLELVRRRDLKGSSFAFGLEPGKGDRWTSDEQGAVREVREVSSLVDVSVVLTPAYPASSVTVAQRSYEMWLASQATEEPAVQAVDSRSALRGVAAAWSALLRLRSG
jgi:phage head maturation protease